MEDDTDYQQAALRATRLGLIVAVWSLAVAVLGLGYTIFAGFGGVEQTKAAVSGLLDSTAGSPENDEIVDAAGSTPSADPTPGSNAASSGSEAEDADSNGWVEPIEEWWNTLLNEGLLKPGLPFWSASWRLSVLGAVFAGMATVVKVFSRKALQDGVVARVWWRVESGMLAVVMVLSALVMGSGVWHTILMLLWALTQIVLWAIIGFVAMVWVVFTSPDEEPRA